MKAYIGIGSNQGERAANIQQAIAMLNPLRVSSILETDPVDMDCREKFLNCAVEVETHLSADRLLVHLEEIERSLGRRDKNKKLPRTIDLDLLLYGDVIVNESNLQVPHPKLTERSFVLEPLVELIPDFIVPNTGKTVKQLFYEYKTYTPAIANR